MSVSRFAGAALVGVPALALAGTLANGGYLSKEAELKDLLKKGGTPSPELLQAVKKEQEMLMGALATGVI